MTHLPEQLVDYIPRLRRYARALLRGDVLAADDLVQDCLERALSRLHLWQEGTDLRAWLFTIMHNLYVNQVRKSANSLQLVELSQDTEPHTESATAERHLELRDLNQAINGLSAEQREILLLVSLEGLRYQEVASILGIPEGTVMSKLSRTREKLRIVMGETKHARLRRVK